MSDVADAGSFKESFRKRGRETMKNLSRDALRSMSGSGAPKAKRRRVQSKSKSRAVKKSIAKAPRKKTKKTKKSKKSKVPSTARFAYL